MSTATQTVKRVPLASKGTRYPARLESFARRLYTEHDYTVDEVRAALAKRGWHPSKNTVYMWCNPDKKALHNQKRAANQYRSRRRRSNATAWWAKYRRMRELRDAGLSFRAVDAVMRLDYGTDLGEEKTRYLLKSGSRDLARKVLA